MNQANDRSAAAGLLTELDDIRALLDDSLPDEAIPVLEHAVETIKATLALADAAALADPELLLDPAELERIPLLDDPVPDFDEDDFAASADDESFAAEDTFTAAPGAAPRAPFTRPLAEPAAAIAPREVPAPFPPGASVAELLAAQELQTAVRNRIDDTFEHWLNDTLQQELNLLRARLLEAVRAEVHEFIAAQINRPDATGRPHGE